MSTPGLHPAAADVETLLGGCDVLRTRGSGPGGQHRNKVETAIVITHRETGIIGQASERRSQNENRREAIVRLRINLAIGYRLTIDDLNDHKNSPLWMSRVKSKRINISEKHDDFPAILAEALDVLAACGYEAAEAAGILDCSSSQLIKLLKKESAALQLVNRKRTESELPTYR